MNQSEILVGNGIRRLCEWAVDTTFADIPKHSLEQAILVIADNLGAVIVSRDESEVSKAHTRILESTNCNEATVFRGGHSRTDRLMAAVANGIAGNGAQLDHGYRKAQCHAGLYIVPALLAEAETFGLTMGEILRATVLSFEIMTRFPRTWPMGTSKFYPAAVFCSIGAAAAVGLARQLPADELYKTLGAASTLIQVGPFRHSVEGVLVCNTWPASGAWNGMMAVEWTKMGFGGTAESPYQVFTEALGFKPHPSQLTNDLGNEWSIDFSFHKAYSSCQYTHSTIEACLAALDELPHQAKSLSITRIVLETSALG